MEWSELYFDDEAFKYNSVDITGREYRNFCDLMRQEYEEAIWEMGFTKGWETRHNSQIEYEENKEKWGIK